ncbi:hypothetical protein [Brachyspira innocens]|uniref:hypothetical protein n=1 Tax=Brachyspira innocens TaxID=13264 RepID=UPI0026EEB1AC|nr:hypothetical protein [Brachyspira innocens]
MSEVYSVGFDLTQLNKALSISERIKKNLQGINVGAISSIAGSKSNKEQAVNFAGKQKKSNILNDSLKEFKEGVNVFKSLKSGNIGQAFKNFKIGDIFKEFKSTIKNGDNKLKEQNEVSNGFSQINEASNNFNEALNNLKDIDFSFSSNFESFRDDIKETFKELEKSDLFKKIGGDNLKKSFKGLDDVFVKLQGSEEFEKFKQSLDELKDSDIFKEFDTALDNFNKDLKNSNKELEKQEKILKKNLAVMNLMRMTAAKLKMGALMGAGIIGGGIAAAMTGGIASMRGVLEQNTRGKNAGIDFGQVRALNFAGKMIGVGEDTLMQAVEGISTSLQDFSKWSNYATLGLNAEELQKQNPTDALFEVLDAMKKSNLPQQQIREAIENMGVPFSNFLFVLEEGTDEMRKYFKEGMGMNVTNINGEQVDMTERLIAGERELIRLGANWQKFMREVGYRIAPQFTKFLQKATPYLQKFSQVLGKGLVWLMDVLDNVMDFFDEFFEAKDKGKFMQNKLSEWVSSAWEFMEPVFGVIKDKVVEYFKTMWDSAMEFIKEKFAEATSGIVIAGSKIGDFFDKPKGAKYGTFDTTSKYTRRWDPAIEDYRMITKSMDWYDPYKHTEADLRMNDGVITKSGQVIQTDPQDYIFAMKQPQRLAEASGGVSYQITINNPTVRDDRDIRQLKSELERLIRSFNSKR